VVVAGGSRGGHTEARTQNYLKRELQNWSNLAAKNDPFGVYRCFALDVNSPALRYASARRQFVPQARILRQVVVVAGTPGCHVDIIASRSSSKTLSKHFDQNYRLPGSFPAHRRNTAKCKQPYRLISRRDLRFLGLITKKFFKNLAVGARYQIAVLGILNYS